MSVLAEEDAAAVKKIDSDKMQLEVGLAQARGKGMREGARDVLSHRVDRVLCKNIRMAGSRDKLQRQQSFKNSEASQSAKAEVAEKEKQARLKHAAQHRKRPVRSW